MPLKREIKALVEILNAEENETKTVEDVAAELIDALDAVRAEKNRLAVVIRHRWHDGNYHMAVLGPFSTAGTVAAKRMGEAACVSLAHPGDGRYALVPAYASPKDAWAEIKPPSSGDLMREQVARDVAAWRPGLWTDDTEPHPTCSCGLVNGSPCRVHP